MTIRLLLPIERKDLEAHLLRLDLPSRTMRFGGLVSDEAIARYVAGIDMRGDLVLGLHDGSCVLRGAAHLAIAHGTAELGLSVERAFRGKGHGTRLLDRAVDCSRFRAGRLTSQCLASNGWMTARLRRLGCAVSRDMETVVATLELAPADAALAFRAAWAEQAGWTGYGGNAALLGLRALSPAARAA